MFSLLGLLGFRKKIFFSLLIISSIFASLLEVLGLGLLIPIVSSLFDNNFYLKFNEYFLKYGFSEFTNESFLFLCILLLPIIFTLKNLFLFFFHIIEANLIYKTLTEFSKKIYKIFLFQKYNFYINENSSNFVNKLGSEFNILHNYLIASVNFLTEIIILTALLFFLLFIAFEEIAIIFLVVLISTFIFYLIFYKKIKNFGALRKKFDLRKTNLILETLKGIKEIKIYKREEIFEDNYNINNKLIYDFSKKYYVLQKIPKLFFEAISILTLSIFIFILLSNNESSEIIIKLTVVTGAIIRILPSLNKVINAYNIKKYSLPAVNDISKFLKRLKIKKIISSKKNINSFEDKILFRNVSFSHKNKNDNLKVFEDLNITIKKGEKISIMGHSGSGKSTFVDLVLGFLKPNKGKILVDNIDVKNYYSNNIISYCPQSIHIFNTSIEKNISLESQIKKININKINKLKKICLLNTFFSKKKNDQKFFGEGGSKISGGQKQRIGIARALYFNPKILVLDESFNAIDNKTAKKIIQNIVKNYPKLTVILVTHSKVLANLSKKIYALRDKKLRLSSE
jgi:ABC-type multidrug transport system fused ATPase/permease subunit